MTQETQDHTHTLPRAPGKERPAEAGLVSVVIPCYNQAHYLGEAIESVLSQSYRNFEIVVVDDGSTDNTSEVASHYEGVRLVRQENRGLSEARNTGIRHSDGEYVVLLDADDRLLPRALEAGLECFDAHSECALVAGHSNIIGGDGSFRRVLKYESPDRDHYVGLLEYCNIPPPASAMFRTSVFETVGGFASGVDASADYEMYLRVARHFPLRRYDEAVADYRMHGENITRNSGRMLSSDVTVLRSQRPYIKGGRRREAAYRNGLEAVRRFWGDPLVERVRELVGEREWKEALRGAYLLARYYPRGLALVVNDRPLLERRLEAREADLRERDRRLKALRKEIRQERRQLKERTQQIRQLRKRARRFEERKRKLQRRLQESEGLSVKYGSLSLTVKTLRCKFLGTPDIQRWKDLGAFDAKWDERTKLIASLIPQGSRIIEFGAGRRELEAYLDPSCTYFPSDLVDRGPKTIICDLNARPLPDLTPWKADVAIFGGVLEYISDLNSVLSWLSRFTSVCIVSYECAHSRPRTFQRAQESFSRLRTGWVNTYSEKELEEIFRKAGFSCSKKATWSTKGGDERIFVFRNESGGSGK
jgi:glycosyltransferase involved in cell wall biosynthesis